MQLPIITKLLFTLALLSSPASAQNTTGPWTTWSSAGLTDYQAIAQTINLDPIATDTKTWSLIPQIFAINATASYDAAAPPLVGIANITTFLINAIAGFTSQHLHGTQLIEISEDCRTANATTFAQATLFADPQVSPGQVGWIYGFYNDELVKTVDGWRISNRIYRFLGPGRAGNITLLES